eukprot:2339659-Amphidinium_carterae.1
MRVGTVCNEILCVRNAKLLLGAGCHLQRPSSRAQWFCSVATGLGPCVKVQWKMLCDFSETISQVARAECLRPLKKPYVLWVVLRSMSINC